MKSVLLIYISTLKSILKFLSIIILFSPILVYSQFSDNFNDSDLINQPHWNGDSSKFIVSNNELQLYDTAKTLNAFLYTSCDVIFNATWEFTIKMSFNPSSSNYANIYLLLDSDEPNKYAEGYFVKVGNSSDEISLYRQDGTQEIKIIDGKDKRLNASSVQSSIKVTRDSIGNWSLLSDTTGGNNFYKEGDIFDNTYLSGKNFGINCHYTSTRSTKFFFDDIIVEGTPFIDSISPTIKSISIISGNEIEINFTEKPDSSVYSLKNYFINNNVGNPDSIEIVDKKVNLFFQSYFPNQINLELTIEDIQDQFDNKMDTYTYDFSYYYAKAFDIVINEIMADPTPTQGMPQYEYIELYNRSNHTVNLRDWQLIYGSNSNKLPEYVFQTHQYLILCNKKAVDDFKIYGSTLNCLSSTTSLINTGSTITLKDNFKQIIHSITYSSDNYDYEFQTEGGWSLEQVDPENPCDTKSNWKTSTNKLGGTPGQKNSVSNYNPDNDFPHLINAAYINDSAFSFFFNETIDSVTTFNLLNYSINHNINHPKKIEWNNASRSSIKLYFSSTLQKRTIYTLFVRNTITDCAGNPADEQIEIDFAIPEIANKNDILINEILFNPVSSGEDYVEIYNNSEKTINLKDLVIASHNETNNEIIDAFQISKESYFLFPKEYLALSTKIEQLLTQYNPPEEANFFEVNKLPSFNNDKGRTILMNISGDIIDEMDYNEDMQFELLNNVEGVSLERISFSEPSTQKENWHSASANTNYGTPGYKNSQANNSRKQSLKVNIEPEVFSPNNDGFNDVLTINFILEKPGYLVNISIYDPKGRLVKTLTNSSLLGLETSINWDGISNESKVAKTGIYMIYIELFNLTGTVEKIRKTCVLNRMEN